MFVGKVDRAGFAGVSRVNQQQQEFQGLSPEFFGPPGPMDKMKDMRLCKALGIDTQGMDRTDIKANILSKLTGNSVDEMKSFYSSVGEQDMKNDMQALASYGLDPSAQPNMMMARAENKALIANQMIQEASGTQTNTQNSQQANSQQPPDGPPPGGGPSGPPAEIQSILSQLAFLLQARNLVTWLRY